MTPATNLSTGQNILITRNYTLFLCCLLPTLFVLSLLRNRRTLLPKYYGTSGLQTANIPVSPRVALPARILAIACVPPTVGVVVFLASFPEALHPKIEWIGSGVLVLFLLAADRGERYVAKKLTFGPYWSGKLREQMVEEGVYKEEDANTPAPTVDVASAKVTPATSDEQIPTVQLPAAQRTWDQWFWGPPRPTPTADQVLAQIYVTISVKTVVIWLWTVNMSWVILDAGRAETAEKWRGLEPLFAMSLALGWVRFFELVWVARRFARMEMGGL